MKKEVKKPSTAPIWGFGGMWVLWCLFAPLYRLWHFLDVYKRQYRFLSPQ